MIRYFNIQHWKVEKNFSHTLSTTFQPLFQLILLFQHLTQQSRFLTISTHFSTVGGEITCFNVENTDENPVDKHMCNSFQHCFDRNRLFVRNNHDLRGLTQSINCTYQLTFNLKIHSCHLLCWNWHSLTDGFMRSFNQFNSLFNNYRRVFTVIP